MSTRCYIVADKKMRFNHSAFKIVFGTFSRSKGITSSKMEQQIADQLHIAKDTIHGWHYGKNSPSSIAYVKDLATALEMSDYFLLLTENIEGKNMNRLTDRQISAAKRIYDACVWFLDEFNHTDGFNDYWPEGKQHNARAAESVIYNRVEKLLRRVNLILDQEYFDLGTCELYNDFSEFIYEDLVDTYNGKVSYAYRFEADPDGNPSTQEDYDKAMIKLNSIIEKYLS